MGKRELLLIAIFVVLGGLIYEVTAPPPPPGSTGASFGGIVRNIQRHIHGNRATAEGHHTEQTPLDATVTELQVNIPRNNDLIIIGEDREDVASDFRVTARGFDAAEAQLGADAAKFKLVRAADALVASIAYAPSPPGPFNNSSRTSAITLRVPKRLRVRIEPNFGRLEVSGVQALQVMGSRGGDTKVGHIATTLTLVHARGHLEVDGAASVHLSLRGSDAIVQHVSGEASIESVGGEVTIRDVVGPLDIESRATDLKLDKMDGLKPPLRVNATSGSLRIPGLKTEARIDGRDTRLDVALEAPAPVTIYSSTEEITVTPPPGGYTLDAIATDGRITMDDGPFKPSETDTEQHVSGTVRGGGPPLTLRSTRAGIRIRARQ